MALHGLYVMQVTHRTSDPDLSDVWPADLSVNVAPCVGTIRPYHIDSKGLRAVLRLESEDPYRPKQELHVLTDDGMAYVWSRFGDDEPWRFEYRLADGERQTQRYRLPGIVEAVGIQHDVMY